MRVLDNDLVNGFFHDETNDDKFLVGEFHSAADPIIKKMVGEVYTPDNLPQICFRMACDIAKRRRRYLFKVLGGQPIKIEKKVIDVDSSDEGDNSDHSEFDESVPGAAADYEDMLKLQQEAQDYRKDCKEKVNEATATAKTKKATAATTKKKAAATTAKKKAAAATAKKKAAAAATAKKKAAAAATAKKKAAAATATAKKKAAAATATAKKKAAAAATAKKKSAAAAIDDVKNQTALAIANRTALAVRKHTAAAIDSRKKSRTRSQAFALWDNVLARWPYEPFHFFPAQITNWKINEGVKTYDVYFLDDGEMLSNVSGQELKVAPKTAKWAQMKRIDYIGFEFLHNVRHKKTPMKFGRFEIHDIGVLPNQNTYVCHCKDPEGDEEEEYYFDVGYVQRQLMHDPEVTPLDR